MPASSSVAASAGLDAANLLRHRSLRLAGLGMALALAIALLEFAYYYPLVSAPGRTGVLLFWSLLVTWSGEGVVLGLTVSVFEGWNAPRPLGGRQLFCAVAVGAVGGVLTWQTFVQRVLRDRFGLRVLRDFMDQPVSLWGVVPYHVWLMLLFGTLAAALYLSRQRHARMLALLRASEIERERSRAQLAEATLVALQARIDPEYVFETLSKLEPLYESDRAAADRMLEDLILFLRRAVAQSRLPREALGEGK